jgi:hypothetical protein
MFRLELMCYVLLCINYISLFRQVTKDRPPAINFYQLISHYVKQVTSTSIVAAVDYSYLVKDHIQWYFMNITTIIFTFR